MLKKWLPGPFLGCLNLLLYVLVTLFFILVLYISALFLLVPINKIRQPLNHFLQKFPDYWGNAIMWLMDTLLDIKWDLRGAENLQPRAWHLMISNHRSWADIFVLQKLLSSHLPSFRFFMKRDLIWQLPLFGFACWLIDFPFMKRYSRDFLKKHPQYRGKDVETTRRSCEKLKQIPTTLVNFVEGGRFKEKRYKKQKPPYQYLLRPRAGGLAAALDSMADKADCLLDVTLVYPNMSVSFWDFLCNRINKVTIHVKKIPITKDLVGDYQSDPAFQHYFRNWLNEQWLAKDKLISHELSSSADSSKE
jgi:1-acyl-sn-glycerol-3-phosphate acyltransferase